MTNQIDTLIKKDKRTFGGYFSQGINMGFIRINKIKNLILIRF